GGREFEPPPAHHDSIICYGGKRTMPVEIYDPEEFIELSKKSLECRIIRKGDVVKLKLRGKKYLYTLKTKPKDVEKILSRINCEVREV
ncbi:MAG: hypothetical protein ACTSW4_02025, partial [Candidatus Ranarchaeia archaeon]